VKRIYLARGISWSLVLLLSGCFAGPHRHDLVSNGVLCVDLEAPDDMPLRDLAVWQNGNVLTVEGVVGSLPAPRDANISVLGPGGTVLARSTGRFGRVSRRGGTRRRFVVSLPVLPPRGSTIRIAY
jgi:hypothetical protein